MAVFEASEGVIKCLPEAGSLKGSLEPENSQMTSDILQNTAVMSTLQVVDNSTKSLETTDNLLASRKPVMFRDVQSEKRVHAVESLYHSLKEASASQLLRASVAGKSAMKKPMRAGVSRSHEVGTSEAVSLKQALRSLTLAQASEMASLKRVSRTPGSAHLVDADAIKQRYRAVLDPQMLEPSSSKNLPRARDISYKKECVIPKVSEKAPEISHLSNGCSSSSLSVGETSLSSVATTSEEKSDNQSIGVVHLSENNKFNREAKDCLHQFENPDEVSSSTEFPYAVRTCSNGSGSSQVMEATESSDTGAVASSSNVGHGIRNAREYQPSTSKKMQKSKQRDCVEVSKSTASRGSTSSGVSDESCCSSLSSSGNRPHMSNDVRWEAIRAIRTKDGCLGLKHFRLLKRLGCGDIGNVYLTELIGTRCFFAMKVMDNESLASQKRMLRAQTEREILQMLDHPFLPTLYTHFETDRFSCLVMEFCPGGDLHILRQRQPGGFFPEQAARFYVAEVLLALEYLHMLGVVYRDLKPENVLVRDDGHIMLSDFDLSLRCADVNPTLIHTTPHDDDDDDDDDDEDADADTADAAAADTATAPKRTSTFCISPACADPVPSCFGPGRRRTRTRTRTRARTRARPRAVATATATATATAVATVVAEPTGARSNSVVGTHEYLAPEIIRNEGHGSGVDWWTLGVLLYELLFGRTPFKGPNHAATLHNVAAAPLCFPPHHSSSSASPSPSPNVSAAAKDLLRRLLAKDAVRRLGGRRGSADIKCHPFFHGLNWALIRCATPPHVPGPYYSSSPSPSPSPSSVM